MKSVTGGAAAGLGGCLIAAIVLTAGCGDRTTTARDDAARAGPGSHRLPAPPPSYPASPPTLPAGPQLDARFLATLASLAQPPRDAQFILDDWRRMYHWWHCPYKPQAVPMVKLDHVGGTLTSRTTSGAKFTHMNRRELKAKGYRPCPHCRPDLDEPLGRPVTAYGEPQPVQHDAPTSALLGACPAGGRHVPGTRDINGRLHCARCERFMD